MIGVVVVLLLCLGMVVHLDHVVSHDNRVLDCCHDMRYLYHVDGMIDLDDRWTDFDFDLFYLVYHMIRVTYDLLII